MTVPEEGEEAPWISVDPDNPDLEKYPLFAKVNPLRCVVEAGEVLYLPALWYHQVGQEEDEEGRTIAVNFWYDMKYDLRFNYFNFMDQIIRLSQQSTSSKTSTSCSSSSSCCDAS